jgi:hypothetical protein
MNSDTRIIRSGISWEDWWLGWQLEVNGVLAPMFDIHKSKVQEVGGYGSEGFESLLRESALGLIAQYGPAQVPGVPAASPRYSFSSAG